MIKKLLVVTTLLLSTPALADVNDIHMWKRGGGFIILSKSGCTRLYDPSYGDTILRMKDGCKAMILGLTPSLTNYDQAGANADVVFTFIVSSPNSNETADFQFTEPIVMVDGIGEEVEGSNNFTISSALGSTAANTQVEISSSSSDNIEFAGGLGDPCSGCAYVTWKSILTNSGSWGGSDTIDFWGVDVKATHN